MASTNWPEKNTNYLSALKNQFPDETPLYDLTRFDATFPLQFNSKTCSLFATLLETGKLTNKFSVVKSMYETVL